MSKPKIEKRIPVSIFSYDAWHSYPSMIHWLREKRDVSINDPNFINTGIYKGTNASILILSACVIEGFLFNCLNTFANPYKPLSDMPSRLEHGYLDNLAKTFLGGLPDAFFVPTGKTLREHLNGNHLYETMEVLCHVRNCLAHSRPFVFQTFMFSGSPTVVDPNWKDDFSSEGKIKIIEDYLVKQTIHKYKDDILTDKVADHFGDRLVNYIQDVLKVLPTRNQKIVATMLAKAYEEVPTTDRLIFGKLAVS